MYGDKAKPPMLAHRGFLFPIQAMAGYTSHNKINHRLTKTARCYIIMGIVKPAGQRKISLQAIPGFIASVPTFLLILSHQTADCGIVSRFVVRIVLQLLRQLSILHFRLNQPVCVTLPLIYHIHLVRLRIAEHENEPRVPLDIHVHNA